MFKKLRRLDDQTVFQKVRNVQKMFDDSCAKKKGFNLNWFAAANFSKTSF